MDEKINYENDDKKQRKSCFVFILSKFWIDFFDSIFDIKSLIFIWNSCKLFKLKFKIFYFNLKYISN
jgi:hypothetical protein